MKNFSRKVFGTLAACVLLPFYAAAWILYGAAAALRDFREFAGDFVKSLTDPDHLPSLGLRGFYTLKNCRQKAYQAVAEDDVEEAVKNWKQCASCFDTDAMLALAGHYESPADDEDAESSRKRACEWYALAACFGRKEGEWGYTGITKVLLDEKEKRWLRKQFIRNRKACLED